MATGSGLDAQLGFAAESTVGTAVTVTKFVEFLSESLQFERSWLDPAGLQTGSPFKRVSRVVQARKGVSGSISMEVPTRGAGLLWKHAVGSAATATQIDATTAYRQIHTPSTQLGLGLTIQIGRPEPSTGTVRPHTFRGCKISGWEFKLGDNAIATLDLTVDGWDEATATALATASYTSANVWNFSQASLKLGGTASTTSGLMSVSGGTAVAAVIRELSIKAESPLATERYGIGNSGLKAEQLENGIPTLTGSFTAEFAKSELYDVYTAGTTTAIELVLTGSAIGVSGHNDTLSFIMPACKFKSANPAVGGPDLVTMTVEWEAYDDGTNEPYQVMIISADTSL